MAETACGRRGYALALNSPRVIASIACAVLAVLCLPSPAQASAAASALTLDSPAPGALVAGGQPTFSGSAATGSGASDQVTDRVYHGSAATARRSRA